MPTKTDADELTDKQQAILETALENPDMSNAEIAAEVDASESYVSQVRNEYEDEAVLEEKGGSGLLLLLLLLLAALTVAYNLGMI
jgi:predicted HTH transcriptional regulator